MCEEGLRAGLYSAAPYCRINVHFVSNSSDSGCAHLRRPSMHAFFAPVGTHSASVRRNRHAPTVYILVFRIVRQTPTRCACGFRFVLLPRHSAYLPALGRTVKAGVGGVFSLTPTSVFSNCSLMVSCWACCAFLTLAHSSRICCSRASVRIGDSFKA